MYTPLCSKLFIKSCQWKEKERRENLLPGMGGDLNLGPPDWQPHPLILIPIGYILSIQLIIL